MLHKNKIDSLSRKELQDAFELLLENHQSFMCWIAEKGSEIDSLDQYNEYEKGIIETIYKSHFNSLQRVANHCIEFIDNPQLISDKPCTCENGEHH
jgi:hypothetical protein